MDRGSYLKSLRLGKGMTQVEAGKLVGVDHSLIGKYEKNSVNIPSDKLEKLAEVYGVAVGDIMSAGGKKNSPMHRSWSVNFEDEETFARLIEDIKEQLK